MARNRGDAALTRRRLDERRQRDDRLEVIAAGWTGGLAFGGHQAALEAAKQSARLKWHDQGGRS